MHKLWLVGFRSITCMGGWKDLSKFCDRWNCDTKTKAVGLFLVALLLVSCTQSAGILTPVTTSTQEGEGRTIVVGLDHAPTTLDPADHRERQSETVIRNMFDGLVTRDTRSGVHLELAEALDQLDEKTLRVRLRRGVVFHDGVEMTADDVVFTFERIIKANAIEYPEPHTSLRQGLITPLESIEKIDDYTVLMHFSGPWPAAFQMLVHQQIVPKHYIEEVGTKGFLEHPVGSGPFEFVSANPDLQEIILERFGDYYGGAPELTPVGLACVDRVIFRVIPDALTRVAALRSGEVDIIQAVPLDLVKILSDTPDVEVKAAPGTRPLWMDMNIHRQPFDDVRVRRALNFAVDRKSIVDEIYYGRAYTLSGPLSPFNNFVNKALEPYPYDPERALALLADAGWEDTDQDGILDKEGQPFEFTLDTLEVWRSLAEALTEQWGAIGITVTLRLWERNIIRPQLLVGERMAYLDGWGDSAFDPIGHFEAKWHVYIEGQPYGRGNYSGYDNQRVNELIRLGELTANSIERQRIYDEAQAIIYEEAPAVFLILPEEIEAATIHIQNWEPASDGRINLHDVCVEP